ncbi:hypothetical protein AVEN_253925-1, partial [Araneus ventricosus]
MLNDEKGEHFYQDEEHCQGKCMLVYYCWNITWDCSFEVFKSKFLPAFCQSTTLQ